ncbi:MAG: LVIVD repeat-containing protein [Candidatus Hodarchaeota archaeon]
MRRKNVLAIMLVLTFTLFISSCIQGVKAADFDEIKNATIGQYKPSVTIFFEEVKLVGTTAYVADAELPGLRVIDVSDPTSPSQLDSATTTNKSYNIDVANNIAFLRVIQGDLVSSDIQCFDVSTPSNPTPTGNIVYSNVHDLQAIDTILYICNGSDVIVINVANVNSPVELDTFDVGGSASISVSGDYIYAGVTHSGSAHYLTIINATNPSSLTLAGNLSTGAFWPGDVAVSGIYAYASGRDMSQPTGTGGNVRSYNVADKSNPIALDTLQTDKISTIGIIVSGRTAYTGNALGGMLLVDVSSPSSLSAIGFYDDYRDTCGSPQSYGTYPQLLIDATHGNIIVWAAMGCGLMLMSVDNLDFGVVPGPSALLILLAISVGIIPIYKKIKKQQ